MTRLHIRKLMLTLSFLLFPVTIYYFSPILIVSGATSGIIVGSFVLFAAQFLLSIFLGRAFCGYVCPAGGLQECFMSVSAKRAKGGKGNLIKYCIWVPWIGSILYLFARAGGIRGIDLLYMTKYGISVADISAYIVYYSVVILVVILALVGGKRSFCHYVCWMAPFMILGTKLSRLLGIPSLKLKADTPSCISCSRCTRACPMSLDVESMVKNEKMDNAECILCGECVHICPKNVLRRSITK